MRFSFPRPFSAKKARIVSVGIAVVLVIMVTAQLFSYEDFPAILKETMLPYASRTADLWAALIVLLEVLSLPFFLGIRLDPRVTYASMLAGRLVIGGWIAGTLAISLSGTPLDNSGVLGATIAVPSSVWLVLFFALLGVLAGLSARSAGTRVKNRAM